MLEKKNSTPFEIIYVHVPCGSRINAEKIAIAAIKDRLASCTHIMSVDSHYEWNSELQKEDEHLLILKTLPWAASTLQSLIEEQHEYDIPCILMIRASVNESYFDWMKRQIRLNEINV